MLAVVTQPYINMTTSIDCTELGESWNKNILLESLHDTRLSAASRLYSKYMFLHMFYYVLHLRDVYP